MKICGSKLAAGLILLLAALLPTAETAWGQEASYLNHDGLSRALRSLAGQSDAVRMASLGRTVQGRDIWVLEIGDPSGTPLGERPAVLLVANLEGNHLAGSHLALETVRYLVDHAGQEAVAELLAKQTVYVFPRLNPDGAERMFARVKAPMRTNAVPFDDDNDGRIDEDGPEDLNGDGYITVMRVPDPAGAYMIDPDESRLMKRADASEGEDGSYNLYWEGTDSDGDGFYNEDGPGGVDLNRNFQHAYPYWQADAGLHMVSEVETRALMDFVLEHRNIGAILTFGLTDNLVTPPDTRGSLAGAKTLDLARFADASNAGVFDVGNFAQATGFGGRFGGFSFRGRGNPFLRGAQAGRDNDPGSGQRPVTTVNNGDIPYFEAVSEAYRKITGIQDVPFHRTPEGAFFDYGYFQYGVPSFSTLGWGLPDGEGEEEGAETDRPARPTAGQTPPSGAAARRPGAAPGGRPGMAAMARMGLRGDQTPSGSGHDPTLLKAMEGAGIDVFADWSPFDHPTLGEVEIGGFLPYATVNPPAGQLAELGAKHGEFLVALAGMLPRVRIVETQVEAHGGGVFSVTAVVENVGFFPTSLRHGQVSRAVQPTTLQIQVDPESILTGAAKTARIQVLNGSGSREEITWVIQGGEGSQVEIKLRAQKGGTDSATVTLR